MFEAGIQMVLHAKGHDVLEMSVVDMRVDTEKSLEDNFDSSSEISREHDANLRGKQVLIVQLVLYPCHKIVYILIG